MKFTAIFLIALLSATSRTAELTDDFEETRLAPFWLPGNYGSGLHAADAIRVSANFARTGKRSLEVTVRRGAMASPGGNGTMTERADMDSGHFALLNQEAEYSYSVFFPKDFPIVDTRLIFGTCKQSDVDRPILAQRFRNGKHTLTIESQGKRTEYSLPKLTLGQWHDVSYKIRYATDSSGFAIVTFDGKEVANYKGPTAEPNFKNAFYHKIGLYRDQMKAPMTVYFDRYTMRGAPDSIAPAKR